MIARVCKWELLPGDDRGNGVDQDADAEGCGWRIGKVFGGCSGLVPEGLVSGSSRRVFLKRCPLLGLALGVDDDKGPVLNGIGLMPGRKQSPDR